MFRWYRDVVARLGTALVSLTLWGAWCSVSPAEPPTDGQATAAASGRDELAPAVEGIRFATFNMALNRSRAGALVTELEQGSEKARKLATIVQLVRPQVLLVNELDYDTEQQSMELLHAKYFEVPQEISGETTSAISYPYRYTAEVNTGVPSGLDLDGNGKQGEATDCFGYGRFPGQYGMAVYSQFPIKSVRTFQKLLWKDMPGAALPTKRDGTAYYPDASLAKFRLSSKSHWDLEIETPEGPIHFLVSHPTPPAFDGPEDRNGRRNHDEIRLLADYITGGEAASYISDDAGVAGGLAAEARFVIAGDLNADPHDGGSHQQAIRLLLDHAKVTHVEPASPGASEAASLQGGKNAEHQGPAAHDTGDFSDGRVGNLRADYVLPGNLSVVNSGVFWPQRDDPRSDLSNASDHRMVWVDVRAE
jgi:hypothetical protein